MHGRSDNSGAFMRLEKEWSVGMQVVPIDIL